MNSHGRPCAPVELLPDEVAIRVDHLWATTHPKAREQLEAVEGLRQGLLYMMGLEVSDAAAPEDEAKVADPEPAASPEEALARLTDRVDVTLDSCGLARCVPLLPRELPDASALSLQENDLTDPDDVVALVLELPRLRALWLNENPVLLNVDLPDRLREAAPQLEILNREFTPSYGSWAVEYLFDEATAVLDLSERGLRVLKPEALVPVAATLRELDVSGNCFASFDEDLLPALQQLPSLEVLKVDLDQLDETSFVVRELVTLERLVNLFPRLVRINDTLILPDGGREPAPSVDAPRIAAEAEAVLQAMWPHVFPMRLTGTEDAHPEQYWYVPDEPAFYMRHSETPNMRIVPQFDPETSATYSMLTPLRPIALAEELTVNRLEGIPDARVRRAVAARLWPDSVVEAEGKGEEGKGEEDEGGEEAEAEEPRREQAQVDREAALAAGVFVDYPYVRDAITLPDVPLADSMDDAGVVWTVRPDVRTAVNQVWNHVPNERCLDDKQEMAAFMRKAFPTGLPAWCPATYSLSDADDVAAFVAAFGEGEPREWIVKRTDGCRGWDVVVTSSLECVLRHAESAPMVVSEYVSDACLVDGHKFDMRYLVLLRSAQPLDLYVYDRFLVRKARMPYSKGQRLDQPFVHITNSQLFQGDSAPQFREMTSADLVERVLAQHEGLDWGVVDRRVHAMMRQLFAAAVTTPGGFGDDPNACSVFGVDVMLTPSGEDGQMEPRLLEVNLSASMLRPTVAWDTFMNDVLAVACLPEGAPAREEAETRFVHL